MFDISKFAEDIFEENTKNYFIRPDLLKKFKKGNAQLPTVNVIFVLFNSSEIDLEREDTSLLICLIVSASKLSILNSL